MTSDSSRTRENIRASHVSFYKQSQLLSIQLEQKTFFFQLGIKMSTLAWPSGGGHSPHIFN